MSRILSLVAFIIVVAAVAAAAGQFMPGAWYAGLAKPSWTPPNWLFGPVWSLLYLAIAVAGWIVWQAPDAGAARWLWALQLALNGAWSPAMFGLHQIGLALTIILVMWLAIAAFIRATWQTQRAAALLFVPYLAWVSFATALNIAIWLLNG